MTPRASRLLTVLLLTLGLAPHAPAAEAPPAPTSAAPAASAEPALGLTADEVRHHLGHVIDWYHRLGGLPANPALTDDVLTRERLHQLRLTEVRLAFGFGRAAAALVVEQPADPDAPATDANEDDSFRYERMATRMTQRAQELRAQVARLDAQLAAAPAQERSVLVAQRAQANAALTLTNEVQATVQRLQQFAARSNSSASGEKGLLADITDMERTVPEARIATANARAGATPTPATTSTAATAPPADPAIGASRRDTPGLVALTNEWFALRSALGLHNHYIEATDELSEALDKLSSGLATEVRGLLRTTAASAEENEQRLAASRAAIEGATERFRELSTLLIPLGEESITLDSAREVLDQRRAGLEQRALAVARQWLLRGGLLVASIAVILGISALWRRATFRYLHDARRRRQFLTLRRIATGAALVAVGFMAFLSEVGSLATYIGFLTAGIAVALQNVILAVVAYFFLIGRYGVRVGDRVTMAGVTGRVAEIGLVRIYLTELSGQDLTPTGRMIVLSNAVVFQPTALFKQLPGVHYTWHTTRFTLTQTADVQLARSRLEERAMQVFQTYRESIETQVRAARHLTDFEASNPEPEVTAKFSSDGLEITVRYPVLPEQAAFVDQQMAQALRAALDETPALQLAGAADASPPG
ncbi:MAG: mechanosensitive ion channel family protein [Steroidobacteraceae bacterium]